MNTIIGNKNNQISPNQIITLNRGDTFEATLFINFGTQLVQDEYKLTENDKVYFAITEANQKFEHAIIKKMYTYNDLDEDGNVVIKLESKDTEHLIPGTYYYEIKLELGSDNEESSTVITIVPKRKLFLVE